MDPVLVDTDVFSFFFRKDPLHELYIPDVLNRELFLSFQSVAELYRWTIERNWGQPRRDSLERALRFYTILPFDDQLARHWAEIVAMRKRAGTSIACGDAWIAATATRFALPLISHNGRHFTGIANLKVICHATTT